MNNLFNPHKPLTPMQRKLIGVGTFILIIAVWSLISGLEIISQNKLPSPWSVVQAFSYLAWYDGQSQLLSAMIASTPRVMAASFFVVLIGIPVGIIMGASPAFNASLSPILDPLRSAPVVAILPILVMWFGLGEDMKIIFLFLGAVVYMIPIVRDAIKAVPYMYWESARDLGATKYECITRAVLPMAMPRIADGIIGSVSIMWTYIQVAEYVNAGTGLGSLIQNAKRFSAMDQVFAVIGVIIFLAFLTYLAMVQIKRMIYPWEGK